MIHEYRPVKWRLFIRNLINGFNVGAAGIFIFEVGKYVVSQKDVFQSLEGAWVYAAIFLGAAFLSAVYYTFIKRDWMKITVTENRINVENKDARKGLQNYKFSLDREKMMNRSWILRILGLYKIATVDKQELTIDGFIYSREDLETMFHIIGAHFLV